MSALRQLDLFPVKPRTVDEATLVRVLMRAARRKPEPTSVMVGKVGRMSRAAIRRLMTPLPPITVPW